MYNIGENCIGCTACAMLCPVSAITGEHGKRHVINEKRCAECGVCGRICHNGAVIDTTGNVCVTIPKAQWKKPRINRDSCSACGICISVCRPKVLRIAMPAVKGCIHVTAELFAPAKCVGCALCSRECPLKAITMKGDGDF